MLFVQSLKRKWSIPLLNIKFHSVWMLFFAICTYVFKTYEYHNRNSKVLGKYLLLIFSTNSFEWPFAVTKALLYFEALLKRCCSLEIGSIDFSIFLKYESLRIWLQKEILKSEVFVQSLRFQLTRLSHDWVWSYFFRPSCPCILGRYFF